MYPGGRRRLRALTMAQVHPALRPRIRDAQVHYALSDNIFRFFLDPTLTYGCAYFAREDLTTEEAQIAKIEPALGKQDLRPGVTVLDVGCGSGTAILRVLEEYDVNVVGLAPSKHQSAHVDPPFANHENSARNTVCYSMIRISSDRYDRAVCRR